MTTGSLHKHIGSVLCIEDVDYIKNKLSNSICQVFKRENVVKQTLTIQKTVFLV